MPVHGQTTVLSLVHACLVSGLLDGNLDGMPLNGPILKELCQQRWGGSIERFFEDLTKKGVTKESINSRVASFKGAIIGWTPGSEQDRSANKKVQWGICPEIGLTLGILSRRVGDIFIASREPDYRWENLFGNPFEVDENLGPAPDLKNPPWTKFHWKLGS